MSSKPPKDAEQNRLTGRLSRYAQVTTAVGGIAARMAGQRYLGLKLDKDQHAADLRTALGSLKGPLMKVAQMLATIPDAVPKEYAAELAQLQADAPPMGWPFVKRRMAAELGVEWESKFKSFTRESVSAASLGQVHQATSLKGELLACKLQYPDMNSAVEADLKQLKLILSMFERVDPAFKTNQVYEEICARLREELDYTREAQAIQLFTAMLKDQAGVKVPKLYPALSSRRLLTMEWCAGQRIIEFTSAPQDVRDMLATRMFHAWYVPFYHYGIIHGDPHPGNYSVGENHTLNILDFGCIRIFPPSFVAGVIALYRALESKDKERIVEAYRSWGFKNLTHKTIDILTIWANFVYGPVLDNRKRLIDETESGLYGRETARKVHHALRDVGGVEVPREFVFMDRAAIGLGSVFFHLKAQLNWYQLFNEMIADFDVKTLEKNQAALLKKFSI